MLQPFHNEMLGRNILPKIPKGNQRNTVTSLTQVYCAKATCRNRQRLFNCRRPMRLWSRVPRVCACSSVKLQCGQSSAHQQHIVVPAQLEPSESQVLVFAKGACYASLTRRKASFQKDVCTDTTVWPHPTKVCGFCVGTTFAACGIQPKAATTPDTADSNQAPSCSCRPYQTFSTFVLCFMPVVHHSLMLDAESIRCLLVWAIRFRTYQASFVDCIRGASSWKGGVPYAYILRKNEKQFTSARPFVCLFRIHILSASTFLRGGISSDDHRPTCYCPSTSLFVERSLRLVRQDLVGLLTSVPQNSRPPLSGYVLQGL